MTRSRVDQPAAKLPANRAICSKHMSLGLDISMNAPIPRSNDWVAARRNDNFVCDQLFDAGALGIPDDRRVPLQARRNASVPNTNTIGRPYLVRVPTGQIRCRRSTCIVRLVASQGMSVALSLAFQSIATPCCATIQTLIQAAARCGRSHMRAELNGSSRNRVNSVAT